MADEQGSSGGGGGASSPLRKTFKLFFVISILILGIQLYLNEPDRRAKVLCLPAYKAYHHIRVTLPGIVLPKEDVFILEGIVSSENFYYSCKNTAKSFPGFSAD